MVATGKYKGIQYEWHFRGFYVEVLVDVADLSVEQLNKLRGIVINRHKQSWSSKPMPVIFKATKEANK